MKNEIIDNQQIYNDGWREWVDQREIGPASRWLRELIHDHIVPLEKEQIKSVLDVGCGQGCTTYNLAKWLPQSSVLGIDFSSTGIDVANELYQSENLAFEVDITSSRLGEKFDLITCFEVLEHVEDWQDLLGRMTAAANKFVMLSFPVGRMRPFEKNVGHLRNFQAGEVEEFMANHQFMPEQLFYAGFPFYSPFYRELCNLTNSGNNSFTRGKYGIAQKLVSHLAYSFFRFASTKHRHGDQFCGLFRKIESK